uniref:hypothetical protein n=1 Tax=Photorhabdus thracensis TaxID=230089 RepID=UPI001E44F844
HYNSTINKKIYGIKSKNIDYITYEISLIKFTNKNKYLIESIPRYDPMIKALFSLLLFTSLPLSYSH